MKNSISTLTDHSTLSLSFHSIELLRALVPTMSLSRDGERIRDPNNGISMKFQRPSEITTGRTTAFTLIATEKATISELTLASHQDGGKCSDTEMVWFKMKKERSLPFQEELIMKTETLSWSQRTARSIRDGKLYMLMNMKRNQLRDNSTRSLDFTLREISTLSQLFQITDTLT
jgi:hypothetical protein